MQVPSPELYVARDVILEESPVLAEGHLADLRRNSGTTALSRLHVTVLSRNQAEEIAEKYPQDDPYDLLVDALGELKLPAFKYAHIKPPAIYGGHRRNARPSYYLASPLDEMGQYRIRKDTAAILGYFGIKRIGRMSPHVTIIRTGSDKKFAEFMQRTSAEKMPEVSPMALFFPVVEQAGRRR